jgi:membrane protease YdiL (CAAX protease family)
MLDSKKCWTGLEDYATPAWLKEGVFGGWFDPCPLHGLLKGRKVNGLAIEWPGDRVFINPPYSRVMPWAERAIAEARFFATSIAGSINYGLIASTVIFQFVFAGFGEEIMFRGYMQSRLNEGFGYPWSLAGVKFGPGLLITSILFGVLHLLNPFNPLQGQFSLAIWSGISSTVAGFLFGFIREKTGDVLAPSIAHGLVDLGQVVPLLL